MVEMRQDIPGQQLPADGELAPQLFGPLRRLELVIIKYYTLQGM